MRERQLKRPSDLPRASEQRLISYALSAGAAGLGALALASTAQAEVVYKPTYASIPLSVYAGGPGYGLDLNGDGVPDFKLANSTFGHGGHALVRPANRINRVLGTGPQAFALEARDSIGSAGPFAHRGPREAATSMGGWAVSSGFESTFGAWGDAHNLYLGLKFVISGEAHFGWARLSYHTGSMYLTGYAYETEPDTPILAGDKGTTGNIDEPISDTLLKHSARREALTIGALALGAGRFPKCID